MFFRLFWNKGEEKLQFIYCVLITKHQSMALSNCDWRTCWSLCMSFLALRRNKVVLIILVIIIITVVIFNNNNRQCKAGYIHAWTQRDLSRLMLLAGRYIFHSILQSFQKQTVEPLLRQYEDARKLGQELVRSAATNVRTTDLESGLDRLDSTWSALNEKVGTGGTNSLICLAVDWLTGTWFGQSVNGFVSLF